MKFKNVFAKEKVPDTLYVVSRGPIRTYVYTNASKLQAWLLTSTTDKIQLIILMAIAMVVRIHDLTSMRKMIMVEEGLVSAINGYISGQFFVDYNPPLAGILFSVISRFLGYTSTSLEVFRANEEYTTLPIDVLRYCNAVTGGLTILLCYKTLRSTGVSHAISIFGSSLLALENSMVTHSRVLSSETLLVFFMMLFFTQHKLSALKMAMGKPWMFNTFIASLSLGLAISCHWLGIFVLGYSLASLALELYFVAGDARKPLKNAVTIFTIKLLCYVTFSTTIYLTIFNIHFQTLRYAVNNSSYNELSPDFQFSLKNNHIENTLLNVGYDSSVMLRHYKSGKYLHSHPDFFNGGHQQVTLLDNYDDTNNLFQILPSRESRNGAINHKSPLALPFRVELFHKETNSTLVIDPNSKPPISEQEYNMQVTTDKNFYLSEEEDEKRRYQFELRMAHKFTRDEQALRSLHAIGSVFQIYNEKNGCFLLGTPLQLHQGYSEGQYEVICIKEPNFEASLWYIDWNINENHAGDNSTVELPDFSTFSKFTEVHLHLVDKLFMASGYDLQTFSNNIKEWVFMEKGYVYLADTTKKVAVYLLGNVIAYYLVILAMVSYVCFMIHQLITFDPHASLTKVNDANYKYGTQTLDFFIGYLLLLLPMKFVNIELHLYNYLPALMIGILTVSQTLQWLSEKSFKATIALMLLLGAIYLLAFVRFSPLIYALPWTEEDCKQLMVSPQWDSWICSIYS
jgi:dolichyl-phosphate-mannose-protein mannosyltransferase